MTASDIYAFRGRVDGKLVGTIGVILSAPGFVEDAEYALLWGKEVNVLLITGEDVGLALDPGNSFLGMMLAKLREAARVGRVFVLDADSTLEPQIERKRREIEAMLEEHRLGSDDVSVCFAVPQIEAWLLAEYEDRPEGSQDPRGQLLQHVQERRLASARAAELARTLDIAKARGRSPSFDEFARTLESVAQRLDRAPAA